MGNHPEKVQMNNLKYEKQKNIVGIKVVAKG